MKPYNFFRVGCLLLLAFATDFVQPTCVLDSDFGFKINCAFKKAGLFRVRNLGGIKAHASLGFSLGDELGFEQSLTNQDPSRRRSVSLKAGVPTNGITDTTPRTGKQEKRGKQNRIMMRPPPPSNRVNPMAMEKLSSLHRRASTTTMEPIVVSGPTNPGYQDPNVPKVTIAKPYSMGVPPFKPLPPKEDTLKVIPITATTRRPYSPLQVPQAKGPSLAYQSENYSYHRIPHHDQVSKMVSQMTAAHMSYPKPGLLRITQTPIIVSNTPRIYHRQPTTVHPFIPMPVAAPPTQAISIIPAPVFKDSVQIPLAPSMLSKVPTAYSLAQNTISIRKSPDPISNFIDPVPQHVHQLANQLHPYGVKKVDDYNSISGYGDDAPFKFSQDDINEKIAEIAKIGNISMEAVEAAILLRQQQLLNQYANIPMPTTTTTTSTTTTTTTTEPPLVFQPEPEPEIEVVQPATKPKRQPTSGKVMNAPKDYYPSGYEKNFDDQFQSKVDLPDTSFHCGDQKYFPGLYGDENLGCMVFHVCALTDDGLVMKSFLCPESTLFDQTILKCNWWFYVDCKSTRKLYDTNIPVSKSYQLMKALTFFSSYKKDMDESAQNARPEEIDGIKEAITILENQDSAKPSDGVQIVTPQPFRSYSSEPTPIYRANRNFRNVTRSSPKPKDVDTSNSEVNYVTIKANSTTTKDISSSTENISKTTSAESSKERLYRRRHTTKSGRSNNRLVSSTASYSTSTTTTTTSTTTEKPTTTAKPTTPSVEIIKQNIQPIEKLLNNYTESYEIRQEKLTDQIADTKVTGLDSFAPIRRFHRSSAETSKEVEMAVIGNEKVQIVRPTSSARLVGEYATPVSAIAKLDEAVLGRRDKKEKPRISIVTAQLVIPDNAVRERT